MRCALYPDYFIFYGDGRQLFARRYRRIGSARLHQPLRLVDDGGTEWCDSDEPIIAIEMIDTIPDPTAPYVFMFEDENALGFWYQGRLRVEQRGRRSIDISEYQFPLVRAPRWVTIPRPASSGPASRPGTVWACTTRAPGAACDIV